MATRERGSATTEVVLLTPVLLFLVMLVVQFGLWYHAEHVVQAAAQEGVRTARLEGSTADAGRTRAVDFLTRLGPTIVRQPVITATRDANNAAVSIQGHAVTVLPGFSLPVKARASSPVERFRKDPG
ncbi:MAG TPA: TadE family protein [Acidimicrobiales bacterium]|nr:TadE family protein [Acidimicrobiales bacterium]HVV37326.1 TadE family protein [Acidimicrobiales bacterium]